MPFGRTNRMADNKPMLTDDEIKRLTPFQHARFAKSMWMGEIEPDTRETIVYDDNGFPVIKELTWVPAVASLFREIIDNSLDEIAKGHGNKIEINYDETTGIMEVADNGRGIPIEYDKEFKMHKATLVLTEMMAGRNFSEDRGAVAGQNGVGAAVVNFCSEFFHLTIVRDGKKFYQEFNDANGMYDHLVIGDPVITDCASQSTGTRIKFRLSDQVFPDRDLPMEYMRARAWEIAVCNPRLKVIFNGEHLKARPGAERNLFRDHDPMVITIATQQMRIKFMLLPNFHDGGSDYVHSVVNNIPCWKGGRQIDQFRKVFYGEMLKRIQAVGKRKRLEPNRSDMVAGLLVYAVTIIREPRFDSQHKTYLSNKNAADTVRDFFKDESVFDEIIKNNKTWVEQVLERCRQRTNKSEEEEAVKAQKSLKKKTSEKELPATGRMNRDKVLFLFEGDSARGNFGQARKGKTNVYGGLPMRGKILNVHETKLKSVVSDGTIRDIMMTIGLEIGVKADRKTLRYGKGVYIATDMDPDGYNILALTVNFFHRFWPELFDPNEEPFFYHFQTPFIIAIKGKQRVYWYGADYPTKYMADLSKYPQGQWKHRRAKGLAKLEVTDWKHALDNPQLTPLVDDGKLSETLDLIFNPTRADDRKEWMGI